MIKILPLEENNKKVEPYFRLTVALGYGEHCDDTFTHSRIEINDAKAERYAALTDEEAEKMDYTELMDISGCITQKEAENIVKFFDSLWKRKDKNGYEVDHVVISDGADEFWWKEHAAMTDKEFDWFSGIYEEYHCELFNPQVENNWCGITGVRIEYVDENNKVHKCEVV